MPSLAIPISAMPDTRSITAGLQRIETLDLWNFIKTISTASLLGLRLRFGDPWRSAHGERFPISDRIRHGVEMNIEEISKRMNDLSEQAGKIGLEIFVNSIMSAYVISDKDSERKKGYLEVIYEVDGEWRGLVRYPDNTIFYTSINNILCDGMRTLIKDAERIRDEGK